MPRPDPIVQAKRVELVDDRFPNEKRRRVAEYIDEHWNEADNLTLTEIAGETGTSRQHVKNTLETHFDVVEPAGGDGVGNAVGQSETMELVLRAYRMGYRDGRQDAGFVEPTDSLEELMEEAR